MFIYLGIKKMLTFLVREGHKGALGSSSLPSGSRRRVGGQIWRFKNEITICQGELEAKIVEDWESTAERERDSDAGGAARNSRRRHYSAPAGHSTGSGHALATAAFFSGQIGQSMHLPVPIPICHCPPVPGAVPLSAEAERPRRSRKTRWENPNFDSIRL